MIYRIGSARFSASDLEELEIRGRAGRELPIAWNFTLYLYMTAGQCASTPPSISRVKKTLLTIDFRARVFCLLPLRRRSNCASLVLC